MDGLILSENYHSLRTLKMIEIANIPVIEIMDSSQAGIQQVIGFDNVAGGTSYGRNHDSARL